MKEEVRQIYVTKEAQEALKAIDTSKAMYKLASELILSGIAQRK